jgi:hypothetical protein
MIKPARLFFESPARNLLLFAAILQLIIVLGLFTVGRLGVAPNQIDDHGLLRKIVPDARDYHRDANISVEILKHSGVRAWLLTPYNAHVKFYSLSYLVFGPLVGNNILSAEPVNLGCYLLILILVFKIGKELFEQTAARAAAAAVAIWPSFLVHNAQILKDPICVVAMLSLVLVVAMWLTRELSWRMGLMTGLLGSTAIWLIYATRAGFWGLVTLGVVLIGALFLIFREVRERSFLAGNTLSLLPVLLLALGAIFLNRASLTPQDQVVVPPETTNIATVNQNPAVMPPVQQTNKVSSAPVAELAQKKDNSASPLPGDGNNAQGETAVVAQPANAPVELTSSSPIKRSRPIALIQGTRDAFADKYRESATLIDPKVQLITTMDVVRYLPRAMEIGFLAPFPNTWLGKGREVGLSGRILSGAEMLAAYILEALALFGVWRARRRLSTWFLFAVMLFGMTTLGLGIINLGALYRLRYGFFVLLIVLGMYGLTQILGSIRDRSIAGKNRLDRLCCKSIFLRPRSGLNDNSPAL